MYPKRNEGAQSGCVSAYNADGFPNFYAKNNSSNQDRLNNNLPDVKWHWHTKEFVFGAQFFRLILDIHASRRLAESSIIRDPWCLTTAGIEK